MLWATFGTAVAVLAAAAFWMRSLLPRRHDGVSAELLNSWLEEARAGGGRGSGVYIRVHGGTESLQVEVRGPPGEREFVLVYPRAEWSEPYFERIRQMAKSAGFRMDHTPAGKTRRWDSMLVGLGADVRAASGFVISILTEVYHASLTDDCRVSLLKFPRDPRRDPEAASPVTVSRIHKPLG